MAHLIGMSAFVKGRKFTVDSDSVRIGRRTGNQIVLDEASISGTHCVINRAGRCFILTDLDSTNGTRVNGAPVHETRLNPKDILQIGNVELMFDGDDVEADLSAAPSPRGVEFAPELARGPTEFQNGSPFKARNENRHHKVWLLLIGLVLLSIIGGVVYYIMQMFSTGT
jgi:pSer/pThr/pTyr-binding forkhead associated (FHA) protein